MKNRFFISIGLDLFLMFGKSGFMLVTPLISFGSLGYLAIAKDEKQSVYGFMNCCIVIVKNGTSVVFFDILKYLFGPLVVEEIETMEFELLETEADEDSYFGTIAINRKWLIIKSRKRLPFKSVKTIFKTELI